MGEIHPKETINAPKKILFEALDGQIRKISKSLVCEKLVR
jgi:hypothetical protein